MKKNYISIFSVFFILTLLFTGCKSKMKESPEKVFEKYVDAAHEEKSDEAMSYCSKNLREKYNNATDREKKVLATMLKLAAPKYPKLLEKKFDKDGARLHFEGKIYKIVSGKKKPKRVKGKMWVEFAKEGNEWKINKMKVDKD